MKVLLAVGDADLEDALSVPEIEQIGSVYDRAEIASFLGTIERENPDNWPDVIVLSSWLPGVFDILDVINYLREQNLRIVFLAGNLGKDDLTVIRAAQLGVKDIAFSDAKIGELINMIVQPPPKAIQQKTEQESNYQDDAEEETEYESAKESVFQTIAKVGGEVKRNIPKPRRRTKEEYESVISVWSLCPAGKTFVASNYATILAQAGYTVALIDASHDLSLHTWLALPYDHDGLVQAQKHPEDVLSYAYQPFVIPGLYVLSGDPAQNYPALNEKGLLSLLEGLQEEVDLIVIDLPSRYSSLTKTALNLSSEVFFVTDMDFNHLIKIQLGLDKLEEQVNFNKFITIVNGVFESQQISVSDAERATGMRAALVIPEISGEVLESIKTGFPVVLFDAGVKELFESLLQVDGENKLSKIL